MRRERAAAAAAAARPTDRPPPLRRPPLASLTAIERLCLRGDAAARERAPNGSSGKGGARAAEAEAAEAAGGGGDQACPPASLLRQPLPAAPEPAGEVVCHAPWRLLKISERPLILVVDGFAPDCSELIALAAPLLARAKVGRGLGVVNDSRTCQLAWMTGSAAAHPAVVRLERRVLQLAEVCCAGGRLPGCLPPPAAEPSSCLPPPQHLPAPPCLRPAAAGLHAAGAAPAGAGRVDAGAAVRRGRAARPAHGSLCGARRHAGGHAARVPQVSGRVLQLRRWAWRATASTAHPALPCPLPSPARSARSDVDGGGATSFPFAEPLPPHRTHVGCRVAPKRGRALLFWSRLHDGSEDQASRHEGEAVLRGTKSCATCWLNEPAPVEDGGAA